MKSGLQCKLLRHCKKTNKQAPFPFLLAGHISRKRGNSQHSHKFRHTEQTSKRKKGVCLPELRIIAGKILGVYLVGAKVWLHDMQLFQNRDSGGISGFGSHTYALPEFC